MLRSGAGNSLTRTYAYDGYQRMCKQIDPETAATIFEYDANGNVTWTATGLGLTGSATSCDREWVGASDKTTRTYDAMNRVTLVNFPDASVDISTTYTPDGLISTLVAAPYTWIYTYNRLRLPTKERMEHLYQGFVYPYGFDWTYTALGHRASMVSPDGLNVPYAPNALGQPTTAGTFATGATYFPDGSLKGFTYGNQAVRTITQNTRMLPSRIADIRSGATILDDQYTYDENGNLTNQNDQLNLAGGDRTLTYDYRDRLTSAQINVSQTETQTETFTYDALDNIRSRQFGSQVSTYNYDGNWRLSSITGLSAQTFAYDIRGNMTSRAGRTHSFDRANRLTSVSGANAGNYEYDGHGRRTVTWRTDGTGKTDIYTLDGVLRFTGDNRRSGNTIHIHLGRQLVAERFRRWDGTGEAIKYVHGDLIGSSVARTSTTGAILERERSWSFGQALDGSKEEMPGFTGHMEDPGIGLVYMQQRYYDPAIGRFLSVDPVGPLSNPINHFGRYHYANNGPYRYLDPDGQRSICHAANCQIIDVRSVGPTKLSNDDTGTPAATMERPQVPEGYEVGSKGSEVSSAVAEVGVHDALVAKILADVAETTSRDSGLPGIHNGPQDAVRHCTWSCEMAKTVGVDKSKFIGDNHEAWGRNPMSEVHMDLHNNSVGRMYGSIDVQSCSAACATASSNGDLMNSPEYRLYED